MEERRRHPRLNMNIPLILRSKGKIIPATMTDLSSSGMGIIADFAPIPNSAVEMIFDISSDTKDVSITGKVTRTEGSNPAKLGIEFTSPFSPGQQTIKEFLSKAYD